LTLVLPVALGLGGEQLTLNSILHADLESTAARLQCSPTYRAGFVEAAGTVIVCPAPIVLEQLGHQQGFLEIKFWMACHFGGALLSGVVVCMIDSSAPHEPYLLSTPMSL
jgi:hypothetical protein